jgi:hypothetical protein
LGEGATDLYTVVLNGPVGLLGRRASPWAASCRMTSCRAGPALWAEDEAQPCPTLCSCRPGPEKIVLGSCSCRAKKSCYGLAHGPCAKWPSIDGGCGNLTLCPAKGRRGRVETRRRAHPDRLERALARGLDARLHLLGCTERKKYQSCMRDRSRLEHHRCCLKQMPRILVKTREKTPAGALTLLQGFGG